MNYITTEQVQELAERAGFFFQDVGYAPTMHTTPMEYSQKCFERLCNAAIEHYLAAQSARATELIEAFKDAPTPHISGALRATQPAKPVEYEPEGFDNCRSETICRKWCGNSACISHPANAKEQT
jgi:hypothetical protein